VFSGQQEAETEVELEQQVEDWPSVFSELQVEGSQIEVGQGPQVSEPGLFVGWSCLQLAAMGGLVVDLLIGLVY
jgi:hypothetical protein